ncbi:hypothetical protein BJY52DRAFT_1213248, partial [Lactarius psammicola]
MYSLDTDDQDFLLWSNNSILSHVSTICAYPPSSTSAGSTSNTLPAAAAASLLHHTTISSLFFLPARILQSPSSRRSPRPHPSESTALPHPSMEQASRPLLPSRPHTDRTARVAGKGFFQQDGSSDTTRAGVHTTSTTIHAALLGRTHSPSFTLHRLRTQPMQTTTTPTFACLSQVGRASHARWPNLFHRPLHAYDNGEMTLGGDDCDREARRARSSAPGFGNAHGRRGASTLWTVAC